MSRKDKNSQNHPLYARVMAMILALSMLLGSSGFQVLAEEIGNQSVSSGEEEFATADQDILLEEEPEQEVSGTAAASSGNTAGADGTSDVLSSDFEIEEIIETTDPGLAGNGRDDLQQTQLEWQKENIRILAEAKSSQEFPEGSSLHFQTLDDLSDSEEGRQGWYDAYVDAAVTAYLQSNQIDETYRDLYKEAFVAMVPFVPSITDGEGQEIALPAIAYTVQFTNSGTVQKLLDKAEEVRVFVYDSERNAKLLDYTEASVSVNESEGAYAASFTTEAPSFAVVKLDCQKLSDAEMQRREAEANTEGSLETESESETEADTEGSQSAESESETEADTEGSQSAESESEAEATTEGILETELESETEAFTEVITEESSETELESETVVDEETLPREWKDEATGVTVTITAAALPEGISLENVQVIVTALSMEENEAIRQELTPDGEESTFVGYDIALVNKEDGEEFEPVSPIDVQIPLPDYLDLYEGELKVYHISEDGAKAVSSAETAEGMAGFAADSFSIWGAFKLGARMAAPVSADSLQALINQATDGEPTTITLEKDYEENLLIPDGKDITIDLNGHTVSSIREDGITTTLTHVSVSGKLTIKGEGSFTNKNNDTDTRGFQVHNGATLTILGGTISGYRIADGNGGGILVSPRGTLSVEGGTISGNQASAYGGGIYTYTPLSLNFVGGVVKGNQAKYGGGIALNTLPENQVIGAVTVTENIASQDGGGFFFSGTSVDVSYDGTTITKNTASRYGGGIGYGVKAVVNLKNVTLNENAAGTYGGGARFFQGSTVTLNNSTVDGNTAYSSGGGISINHGTNSNVPSTLTINGGSISENNLTSSEDLISGYGAGIYGYRYVTVILNDGEISKNTGAAYGGGIYLEYYSPLTVNGGKISGNVTKPVTDARGGGFYLQQGDFTMTGGEISDNVCTGVNANGGGGAIASGRFFLSGNSVICGNTSSNVGGGFYANGGESTISDTVRIEKNKSGRGGGFYKDGSAVVINGGIIQENTASSSGGGFCASLKMNDGVIRNNTSGNDGGGVCVWSAEMTGGEITGNKAVYGGGIASCSNSSFSLTGGKVIGNTATYGGGVFVTYNMYISVCTNDARKAVTVGGDVEISGNSANYGGGLFLQHNVNAAINGGIITGNQANICGGGVYVERYQNLLDVQGGNLSGNRANQMGNDIRVYSTYNYAYSYVYHRPILKLTAAENMVPTGIWYDERADRDLEVNESVDNTEATAEQEKLDAEGDRTILYYEYTFVDRTAVARVGEKTYNTIQSAVNAIASGETGGNTEILLLRDTTESVKISGKETSDLTEATGQVEITLNLDGHTVQGGSASVFTVTNGTSFIIKDTSEEGTGAITAGPGTLLGTTTQYRYGGGIYIMGGGKVTLESGRITGNRAKYGGGIYMTGTKDSPSAFVMNGGAIEENTVETSYGGIFAEGYADVTIQGGSIRNHNTTSGSGQAIGFTAVGTLTIAGGVISGQTGTVSTVYVNNGNAKAIISGGEITDNNGTGIYVANGFLTMTGGKISGNTSNYEGGGVFVGGSGTFIMTGGSITGNTASRGGAVYTTVKTSVQGGEIIGNIATSNGGGIYFDSNRSQCYFELTAPSKVYGNVSKTGSANDIYLKENADITNNPVMAVSEMELGDEYDCWFDAYDGKEITGKITERQNRIYELTAAKAKNGSEDAVVRIGETGYSTIQAAVNAIIQAEADAKAAIENGGTPDTVDHTIYLLKDVQESFSVSAGIDVILDLNGYALSSTRTNGISIYGGAHLVLQNTTDSDDHGTGENGGTFGPGEALSNSRAVYVYGRGTDVSGNPRGSGFTLQRGVTIENFATSMKGGAIYGGSGSDVRIKGGTIQNCRAANGGAIYSYNGSGGNKWQTQFHMEDGLITDCHAENEAGGIECNFYSMGSSITNDIFEITGGTVQNCSAVNYGAIYIYGRDTASKENKETIFIQNSKVINNHADKDGGGIYIRVRNSGTQVLIKDTLIDGNSASTCGGLGLNTYNRNRPVLENVTVTNNTTKGNCAGIYSYGPVEIRGGLIQGNKTTGSNALCGALYVDQIWNTNDTSISDITDLVVKDNYSINYANDYSGNVYLVQGKYNLTNATIQNNRGLWNAGLNIYGTSAVLDGCTISDNTSSNSSSAFLTRSTNTVLKGGTKITGNRGASAIYNYNSSNVTLDIEDAEISGNSRGIFYQYGTINVNEGAVISGNGSAALSAGGGIYLLRNARLNMNGGKITGNKAIHGAAVYMESAVDGNPATYRIPSFVMTGGEISGNTATKNGGAIAANADRNGGWIGNSELMAQRGQAIRPEFVISGGVITGNSAGASGGGIYANDNGNVITLAQGGQVYGNSAGFGQDIYADYNSRYIGDTYYAPNELRLIKAEDMFAGDDSRTGVAWLDEDRDTTITQAIRGKMIRRYALTLDYDRHDVVAVIGNDTYISVQSALDAVAAGRYKSSESEETVVPEIRIVKDVTESVEVAAGSDVILNLNGYRLQGTNTAVECYGKVIIRDNPENVTIDEISYPAGESTGSLGGNGSEAGGGIRVYAGGYAKLESGELSGSRAGTKGSSSTYGGGAVCVDSGTFEMTGGVIRDNIANFGAAVLVRTASSRFVMSDGTICDNNTTATEGGTIHNVSGRVQITGGVIENNTSVKGGALYNQGSGAKCSIVGADAQFPVIIRGNTTTNNGGAIYMATGTVTLGNVTLTENTSATSGGAVYVYYGSLAIGSGMLMTKNEAANYGGAIYMEREGRVNMLGGTITANRANYGGGVAQSPSWYSRFNLMGGGVYNNVSVATSSGNDFYSKYTGTDKNYPSNNNYPRLTVIPASEMGNAKYNVWRDDTYTGTTRTGVYILEGEYITGNIVNSVNLELTADYYDVETETNLSGDFEIKSFQIGSYDSVKETMSEGMTDGTAGFDTRSAGTEKTAQALFAAGAEGVAQSDQTYFVNGEVKNYISITKDGKTKLYEQDQMVQWTPGDDAGSQNSLVRSYDTLAYKLSVEIGALPGSGNTEEQGTAPADSSKTDSSVKEDEDSTDGTKTAKNIHVWLEAELPASDEEAEFSVGANDFNGYSLSSRTGKDGKTVQILRGYKELTDVIDAKRADFNVSVAVHAMKNGDLFKPVFRCWVEGNEKEEKSPKEAQSRMVTVSASGRYNVTLDYNNQLSYTGYFDLESGEEVSEETYKEAVQSGNTKIISGTMLGYGVTVQLYNEVNKGLKGLEIPNSPLEFDLSMKGSLFLDGEPVDGGLATAPYFWAYKESTRSFYGRSLNSSTNSFNLDWNDEDDKDKTTSYAYNAAPFNSGGGDTACYNGGSWTITGNQTTNGQEENTFHVKVDGYTFALSNSDSSPSKTADGVISSIFGASNIKPFSAGYIQVIFPLTEEQKNMNQTGYLSLHMDAAVHDLNINTISGLEPVGNTSEESLAGLRNYYGDIETAKIHATSEVSYVDNYRGFDTGLYIAAPFGGPGASVTKENYFLKANGSGISGSAGNGSTPLGSSVYIAGNMNYGCSEISTTDPKDPAHYIAPEDRNIQIDNYTEFDYMTAANLLQKFDADVFTPYGGAAIVDSPSNNKSNSTSFNGGNIVTYTDETATEWSDTVTRSYNLTVLYAAKPDGTNWVKKQLSGDQNDGGVEDMDHYREEGLLYFTTLDELYAYFAAQGKEGKCVGILYEFRNTCIRRGQLLTARAKMKVTDDFKKTGHTYCTTNDTRIWTTYRPEYKRVLRGLEGNVKLTDILYDFSWLDDVYSTNGATAYGAAVGYGKAYAGTESLDGAVAFNGTVDPDNGYLSMKDPDGEEGTIYHCSENQYTIYKRVETVNEAGERVIATRRVSGFASASYHNGYIKTQYRDGSPQKGTHNGWRKGNTLLLYTLNATILQQVADIEVGSNAPKNTYNVGYGERTVHFKVTPMLAISSSETINQLVENGSQPAEATITLTLPRGLGYVEKSLVFDYSKSGYEEGSLEWTISDPVTDPETGLTTVTLSTIVSDISRALPTFTYTCSIGDVTDPENDVRDGASLISTASIHANYQEYNNVAAKMDSSQSSILIANNREDGIYLDTNQNVIDVGNEATFRMHYMRKNEADTPFEMVNVLPYKGDGRGTDFDGQYRISALTLTFNDQQSYEAFLANGVLKYAAGQATGSEAVMVGTAGVFGTDGKGTTIPQTAMAGDPDTLTVTVDLEAAGLSNYVQDAAAANALALYAYVPLSTNTNKTVEMDLTISPMRVDGSTADSMLTDSTGKKQSGGNVYGDTFVYIDGLGSLRSSTCPVRVVNRKITGIVWLDQDQDGVYASGSTSVPGYDYLMQDVDVSLFCVNENGSLTPAVDTVGAPVPSVTTNVNGYYCFENLPEGTYTIQISDQVTGSRTRDAAAVTKAPYTVAESKTSKTRVTPIDFTRLSVTKNLSNGLSNVNTSKPVYDGTDTATDLASLNYVQLGNTITLPSTGAIKTAEYNSANHNFGLYYIRMEVQKNWNDMVFQVRKDMPITLTLQSQTATEGTGGQTAGQNEDNATNTVFGQSVTVKYTEGQAAAQIQEGTKDAYDASVTSTATASENSTEGLRLTDYHWSVSFPLQAEGSGGKVRYELVSERDDSAYKASVDNREFDGFVSSLSTERIYDEKNGIVAYQMCANNTQKQGSFSFTKVSNKDHDLKLKEAEFALYYWNSAAKAPKDTEAYDSNTAGWINAGTAVSDADGLVNFDGLPAGIYRLIETKAPENTTNSGHTVTYEKPDGQWMVRVKLPSQEGAVSAEITTDVIRTEDPEKHITSEFMEENGKTILENIYKPNPVELTLDLSKLVTGYPQKGQEFTFNVTAVSPTDEAGKVIAPAPDPASVTVRSAGEKTSAAKASAMIAFEKEGTYGYTLQEVKGDHPIPGYTYDETIHQVQITVEDCDGQLKVTKATMDGKQLGVNGAPADGDTILGEEEMKAANKVDEEKRKASITVAASITNVYETDPAQLQIPVQKIIEAAEGYEVPTDDDHTFTFEIIPADEAAAKAAETPDISGTTPGEEADSTEENNKDENGALITVGTASVKGAGFVQIPLTINRYGTFTYKIVEKAEEGTSYHYDKKEYTLTVTAKDDVKDGRAVISAEYTIHYKNPETGKNEEKQTAVFTNIYEPGAVTVTIPLLKTVTGKMSKDTDFRFCMTPYNVTDPSSFTYALVTAKAETGKGEGAFELSFKKKGTYYYQISEVRGTEHGYTYDTTSYIITVTVTESKGELHASWTANSAVVEKVEFVNTYTPDPVNIRIPVEKVVKAEEGVTIPEEHQRAFTFRLETDEADTPMPSKDTVTVNAGSKKSFDAITFTKSGTYTYIVTEQKDNDRNYVFDTTPHKVQVVVTDTNGVLSAKIKVPAENTAGTVTEEGTAGAMADHVTVTNRYEPKEPHISIKKETTSTPANRTDTDSGAYELGETIAYKITVTNDGEVPLVNLETVDELTGKTWTRKSLKVGESCVYTTEYVVKEADIKAGKVVNEAVVTAVDPDDPNRIVEPDQPARTEDPTRARTPHLTVTKKVTSTPANKTATEDGAYGLGEKVTYEITVTNDGNVTLKNITLTDGLTDDEWNIDSLVPGQTSRKFTTAYTVKEENIRDGFVTNKAVAEAPDPDDPSKTVTGEDTAKVFTEEEDPKLSIAKTVTNEPENTAAYGLGETITYKITVKNTGNVSLVNAKVEDALTGHTGEKAWNIEGIFKQGDEASFETSYVVTEEDLTKGEVVNTAVATAENPDSDKQPDPAEATATAPAQRPAPSLTVEKKVLSVGGVDTEPLPQAKYGDVITYEIKVTNNGNRTLTNISVEDSLTGDTWTIQTLAPNESDTHTVTYTAQLSDIKAGTITNVATAKATDPDDPDHVLEVSDQADAVTEPRNPQISLTKETTSLPADKEGYGVGERITYKLTVTNEGNIDLADVVVTDALTGLIGEHAWNVGTLQPGGSRTLTTSYVVTEADVIRGSVENKAAVTAKDPVDPDAPAVTDEASVEDKTEKEKPHLTVLKETISEPKDGKAYALGEKIRYKLTVVNDGNLTVSDISVTDVLTGNVTFRDPATGEITKDTTLKVGTLAPGKRAEAGTVTYTVTEEDVRAGNVHNIATASGTTKDPDYPEVPVTPGEVDDSVQKVSPSLHVVKNAVSVNGVATLPLPQVKLGDQIAYEITVTNNGNVTLENIVVNDNLTGNSFDKIKLEPGDARTFTVSYKAKEKDIRSGKITNVATAEAPHPQYPDDTDKRIRDDDTETILTEEKNAHLTITKRTTSTPDDPKGYHVGETISYELTVVNDGNITLTDVIVTDELTGVQGDTAWQVGTLAPGQSQKKTVSYKVTEADILKGTVVNVATAVATDPEDPDNPIIPEPGRTEDKTEPKDVHMSIRKETVSKPANETVYVKGETIRYKLTAVNDGNVTLHDVVVSDVLTGDSGENAWKIGILKPGETAETFVSYQVKEADSFIGHVDNEATGRAKDPEEKDVPVAPGTTTDPVETPKPSLHVEKVATAPSGSDGKAVLGETITYTIKVTNNGNVALDNVVTTDDLTGESWMEGRMESGESKTYTTTYKVTEEDIFRGYVVNVATAEAPHPQYPDDPDKKVTGTDTESVPVEDMNPHITVEKETISEAEDGEAYVPGETITYRITVTNDGNLTLENVAVIDELTGNKVSIDPETEETTDTTLKAGTLKPGESKEFTVSYVVTEEDGIAGKVINQATATADNPVKPENPDDPKNPPIVPDKPAEVEDDTQPKYVPYTVAFFYQDEENGEYPEEPTEVSDRIGTVRTIVSVTEEDMVPELEKYAFDESADNILKGTVVKDGSLVLKVYFKRQYQVVYEPGIHGTFEPQSTEGLDYADPTPAFLNHVSCEPGYTFAGWDPKVEDKVTKDIVYVAQWEANTDTPYTVEHYLQQPDGSYKLEEDSTQHLTGVTGELAVYVPKSIQGYQYRQERTEFVSRQDNSRLRSVSEIVKKDATILGDGSLVIKLYYNVYEVSTSLTATKVIEGPTPEIASTFTFNLKAIGENAVDSPILQGENRDGRTVLITGAGTIDFGSWTYYKEGIYTYTVTETAGSDEHYSYDSTVYLVTDTVKDQNGQLAVERKITISDSGETVTDIVFTNILLKQYYYMGESETEEDDNKTTTTSGGSVSSGGGSSYGGSSGSSAANPKTGDDTPVELWLILMLAALIMLGAGGLHAKKRR